MITCAHRAYAIKVGAVLLVSPIIVGVPDLDRSYGYTDSVAACVDDPDAVSSLLSGHKNYRKITPKMAALKGLEPATGRSGAAFA
ncbi:hypothetical protein NXC12_PD00041 (plasmid) [Rhizobium etli]|uniref:Uncharacterized protein n=1 Tax=Rhizobium etli TaxID=29449 RepID=A0AAN1EMW3_RHIET|nr:hypothetical protein NXC12_PD00041 [Rhizobium etli]